MAGRKSDFTLTKLDDLFTTQAQRDEEQLSKIRDIPLELIDDFPNHPFKVRDDEDMMQLVESVKERGVITPATVRQKEDGRYELVSGHRRKRACELAGFETLRSEIVDLNRDEATILMVESNFQRSEILPSEKAFAYKMRLEAMKRQAGRPSKENGVPVGHNSIVGKSREILASESQDSNTQIQRYVRLTNLVPELLEFVDEGRIKMEHIKLALQGYNFGNGYISWAKTKYGGYSYANAVEFSIQQAQRLGWDSYGDTQYPAHVLRYYPYGRAFTAGGNQAIVEVALTQLGNQGGQPYWSWYGFNSRVEWCACFVSWCADQCGYIESGLVPKFAGCVDGANWFKSNGKWQDRTYEPKVGDIIFFDWEGDGTTDHVGIVEKCENGTVYTVEGNSGDACKQRQYAVGSSNIYGYGIPAY